MKLRDKWSKTKWAGYAAALCVAAAFYVFLTHFTVLWDALGKIFGYFLPVIVGIALAYVINPLVTLFQNTLFKRVRSEKRKRGLAVLIGVIVVIVFIVLLLVMLIPQVIDSIGYFITNIDRYANDLQGLLDKLQDYSKRWDVDISSLINMGDDLLEDLSSTLPKNLNRILNTSYSIGVGVFNGVISFILAVYFLVDKNRCVNGLRRFFKTVLPENKYSKGAEFWHECNTILVNYVVYDLLDGLIIGTANFVFFLICDFPYGILISTVVGITNLAPTFGPILGAAVGSFILVLVKPWDALWFLVFTFILQTIDGYILKPKLFGGLMGVPDVWILVCLIMGGRIFGVTGILLAIPFAAISDFIYSGWISRKETEKEKKKGETFHETEAK